MKRASLKKNLCILLDASLLTLVCFLGTPALVFASEIFTPASPTVDFEKQVVTVWGLAGQPWEENVSYEEEKARAWMDAMHHAYAEILEIPLAEGLSVRSAVAANGALKERIGQLLYETNPVFYDPDISGLVRCRLELPFFGKMSLRSALYLAALRPRPQEPTAFLASWTQPASTTLIAAETASESVKNVLRTILDLRRTQFAPSLFPRFFSETGELLFQEAQIPGPERFSRPAVRFTERIESAAHGFKSSQLLYIEATVSPTARHDILVKQSDIAKFLAFSKILIEEPLDARDIMIVYGNRPAPFGIVSKSAQKEKEKSQSGTVKKP